MRRASPKVEGPRKGAYMRLKFPRRRRHGRCVSRAQGCAYHTQPVRAGTRGKASGVEGKETKGEGHHKDAHQVVFSSTLRSLMVVSGSAEVLESPRFCARWGSDIVGAKSKVGERRLEDLAPVAEQSVVCSFRHPSDFWPLLSCDCGRKEMFARFTHPVQRGFRHLK